jgi:predicted nucleic acid-binding protein
MALAANSLDTNGLIYAFSEDARAAAAQSLIAEPFVASTQALNEFANVAKKKKGNSWTDTRQDAVCSRTCNRSSDDPFRAGIGPTI